MLGKKRRPSGGDGGALSRSENPDFGLLSALSERRRFSVMWLPAATSHLYRRLLSKQSAPPYSVRSNLFVQNNFEGVQCKSVSCPWLRFGKREFEAPATARERFAKGRKTLHMAAVDSDFDGYDTAMAMAASGAGQIRAVPESQHALMSAAMLDAKRARMKVENDREALANRIARLQAEELRATKRIEQTVCAHTSCYDCTLLVSSSFVFFSHDCLL